MTTQQITEEQLHAFGNKLEAFGNTLLPQEQELLAEILSLAAARAFRGRTVTAGGASSVSSPAQQSQARQAPARSDRPGLRLPRQRYGQGPDPGRDLQHRPDDPGQIGAEDAVDARQQLGADEGQRGERAGRRLLGRDRVRAASELAPPVARVRRPAPQATSQHFPSAGTRRFSPRFAGFAVR